MHKKLRKMLGDVNSLSAVSPRIIVFSVFSTLGWYNQGKQDEVL